MVSTQRLSLLFVALAVALCASSGAAAAAAAATTGSLYQKLVVSWSNNKSRGHDRADFQIPGIGYGDVVCSPDTTWIQMVPSDRDAENDMWSVVTQTKNGVQQTAVKDARVYEFSTPTSTTPHGTGASAYEGFNQHTPVEAANSGSMIGLISKRAALNTYGGVGVAPTSIDLQWAWSGFGTKDATCRVTASFVTEISGPSRRILEGAARQKPSVLGAVSSFNLNWHGESEETVAAGRPNSLTIPNIGVLHGVCEDGTDAEAYLALTPYGTATPYASVTTYQGEGIYNSTVDDYYTDPVSGAVGPIALPVNGFVTATVLPGWYAPATQETELLISSYRITNNPNGAADYCEISVEALTAPDPFI